MTPETISHYRLLEKLGAGGMGVVYAAEDLKLGRKVALKFLAIESSRDPAALYRFEREARSASSLNHPNICTIYDIDEQDGVRFMAMELLKGKTLKERIANQTMPLDELLDYAVQIASALEAAHAEGIIHRDIKPANIFITLKGYVKLLDFGLAKLSAEGHGGGDQETMSEVVIARQHLTLPGVALGTIAYMSPEQALGEPLDGRTDLFSFGAVLYQMATGRQPFAGNTSAGTIDAILHKVPSPVVRYNPSIPPDLQSIISKALEKDRSLRYQSATDMRDDLQRVQRDLHLTGSSAANGSGATQTLNQSESASLKPGDSSGQKVPSRPAKKVLLFGGIALAILLLAGLAMWWRTSSAAADAYLKIESNPGAHVVVDDNISDTIGPNGTLTVKVTPGTHSVHLSLKEHDPYSTRVDLSGGERKNLYADLRPTPPTAPAPVAVKLGDLLIRSNVAGADILVNGQLKGFTGPDKTVKMQLNEGSYSLQLQKAGYKDSPAQQVAILANHENQVTLNLVASESKSPPPADTYLVIKSNPGAEIRIDGNVSGMVDGDGNFPVKVDPGKHQVQASLTGYEPYSSNIPVKANAKTYLVADMKPLPPVVGSFSASQSKITSGQTTSLKWATQNATEVRIEPGLGTVSPSGAQEVSPVKATIYVLTAKGTGGSVTAKVSIAVEPNPAEVQTIKETMARFKGAYDSMDINAVRREWPSLTQTQSDAIKTTFLGLTSVRLNDECDGSPTISGDTAEWTCVETITYVVKGQHQIPAVHNAVVFHFKRAGAKWYIDRREKGHIAKAEGN